MVQWSDTAYDWAIEFDTAIKTLIEKGDHAGVMNYTSLGRAAQLAVPTNDHFLPLIYTLGVMEKDEQMQFFNEKNTMGAVSMRSFVTTA